MPRIISFNWTLPAVVMGRKTTTRRFWDKDYALRLHQGDLLKAYDRSPRVHGVYLADVRLTAPPVETWTDEFTDEDYRTEGFEFLDAYPSLKVDENGTPFEPETVVEAWRMQRRRIWLVRFELVDLTSVGREYRRMVEGVVERADQLAAARRSDFEIRRRRRSG